MRYDIYIYIYVDRRLKVKAEVKWKRASWRLEILHVKKKICKTKDADESYEEEWKIEQKEH